MSLQEQSDFVLAFARVLHVNGESTDETVAVVGRLVNSLDLRATVIPNWGGLELLAQDGTGELVSVAAASPTGVT